MHRFHAGPSLLRLILMLAALALVGGCADPAPEALSRDASDVLRTGEAFLNRVERTPGARLTDEALIAAGYAERVRLGLGSPFRIAEFALNDPLLSAAARTSVAAGIIARVARGDAYRIDPAVFDLVRLAGAASDRASQEQLEMVENVVATSPTATSGERTVRMGYLLASGERTVRDGGDAVPVYVAALVADRRRARGDAERLIRAAEAARVDPTELLVQWRRQGRFSVEEPAYARITVAEEEAEARYGPNLALALRALAQRESAPGLRSRRGDRERGEPAAALDSVGASRLARLVDARNYPAQAPVAVSMAIHAPALEGGTWMSDSERRAREALVRGSHNEEALVAHAAQLRAAGQFRGGRLNLALIQTAAFLRGWNQEEPWFPGDPAPTTRELETRFGLRSIAFAPDVDETWKPYLTRQLGRALTDLERALPAVSFRGLAIEFAPVPTDLSALALHEPGSRTLYLPPETGAGTLAHEFAHDLDWQLAQRRYGARGGYATDLSISRERGDRISAAMMELSATLGASDEAAAAAHRKRPAEVFARGTDWLVANVLANDGRLGGYLSSYQDAAITGYGTTRDPDVSGAAVPALLSLLDAVASVPDSSRDWIMRRHGPSRPLTAMEQVRAVVTAADRTPTSMRMAEVERISRQSAVAVSQCRYGSADGIRRMAAAQTRLADAAVGAALRGAAIDQIHGLVDETRPGMDRRPVDQWIAWRLDGAPEPVDPSLEALVPAFEDIVLRAELIQAERLRPMRYNPFEPDAASPVCAGNPFAAGLSSRQIGR